MRTSEAIGDLCAALALAQGGMTHAAKDATNPHFKSRYADLASLIDAARESLAEHGLAVVQAPEQRGDGWILVSRLTHSSGQWIESDVPILLARDNGPQAFGSALTYARRYGFAALVGVAPDDDDGEAAQGRSAHRRMPETSTTTPGRNWLAEIMAADLPALDAIAADLATQPDEERAQYREVYASRRAALRPRSTP